MILSGRIDQIIGRLSVHRRLVVEMLHDGGEHGAWLRTREHIAAVTALPGRLEIDFAGQEADSAELLRALVDRGAPVRAFYETRLDVEGILLRVGAREAS